mgnify:CR=1 FL=1
MCALASRAASPGIGIAKSSSSVKSVTACIPFAACSLRRALCIRAFGGTDPSAAMQLSRFAMQKKPSNANQHFSKRTFTPRTCSRPVAVRWSSECSANLKAIECTFTPRRLRCPSCVAMRVDLQCSLRSLDARSHLGFAAVRLHCDGGGSHQSGRRRHVWLQRDAGPGSTSCRLVRPSWTTWMRSGEAGEADVPPTPPSGGVMPPPLPPPQVSRRERFGPAAPPREREPASGGCWHWPVTWRLHQYSWSV